MLHHQAVALYPGSRQRESVAQLHIALPGIHPDLAKEALERALKHDPFSPILLSHMAFHQVRRNDLEAVEAIRDTMVNLFPELGETAFVEQLLEEAR